MCKNEQILELEPEPCYQKESSGIGNRAMLMKREGSGAGSGAVACLPGLRSPAFTRFVA